MTNINDDIEKDFEAIENALNTFNQEEPLLRNIEEATRCDLEKEFGEMADETMETEQKLGEIDEKISEEL